MISALTTRPRILLRAAHTVARTLPGAGDPVRLEILEAELDTARRAGLSGYSPRRHVTVLAELLSARARSRPA